MQFFGGATSKGFDSCIFSSPKQVLFYSLNLYFFVDQLDFYGKIEIYHKIGKNYYLNNNFTFLK